MEEEEDAAAAAAPAAAAVTAVVAASVRLVDGRIHSSNTANAAAVRHNLGNIISATNVLAQMEQNYQTGLLRKLADRKAALLEAASSSSLLSSLALEYRDGAGQDKKLRLFWVPSGCCC